MTLYDPGDPYSANDRARSNPLQHLGVRVGAIGGVIMVCVHLILLLIYRNTNQGDLLAWVMSWFVYFLIGRVAGQRQYERDRDTLEPCRNVPGAAVGAALITSLIIWAFIIFRVVFRDAHGVFVMVEPFSLACAILFDVLVALGLGAWAGRTISSKCKTFTGY